jgi:hypothetical protein
LKGAGKDHGGDRARRLDADRIENLSLVPMMEVARCVFGCEGPRPLIDVWIVHRRPQLAAEKAEMEGSHFWTARCGFGILRVEWVAVGEGEGV